jgi:DNA-damage-inducible protein J
MGLTVSDVVRILLTRIANEGALPFAFTTDPETHDEWFRRRVLEALDDKRPAVPDHDVESPFAARREAARKRSTQK